MGAWGSDRLRDPHTQRPHACEPRDGPSKTQVKGCHTRPPPEHFLWRGPPGPRGGPPEVKHPRAQGTCPSRVFQGVRSGSEGVHRQN